MMRRFVAVMLLVILIIATIQPLGVQASDLAERQSDADVVETSYIDLSWNKTQLITYITSDYSISARRKAVIVKGLELLNYTKYNMGSKAANDASSMPRYLDCSGFVQWALLRGAGYDVGHGTASQYANTPDIDESELRIGDLAFIKPGGVENLGGGNHVGFFIGYAPDGQKLWLHCTSGSKNGVCISTCNSFAYYTRPDCFE